MERPEKAALISAWCRAHPRSVLFDEASSTLLDVSSGKTLTLDLGRVTQIREEKNPESGGSYLVLHRDDELEMALSDPGIAFALDTHNSGPIPNAPKAVCLRDFAELLGRLRHHLFDHPEAPVTRDQLAHVQFGIALLDGANRAGLDVGREVADLEKVLAEIERRGPPPG